MYNINRCPEYENFGERVGGFMNIKLWPKDPDCSCEECTCDQATFGEKRECDCMKCDCEKCHTEDEEWDTQP